MALVPRQVVSIVEPQAVLEGAGVRLIRTIASRALDYLDPFLLLDDFGSDNPDDYLAGFPMHPHRGIETVTYMLSGEIELAQAVERNYLIDADVLVGERAAMNAADVFSSSRFRALIAEARARYDVVIIDTPPVLVVPDARVVAQFADSVIYAVEWNATPKRDVIAGLRMMSDGGVRVTGLALTRIDLKKLKRYGAYAGYGTYAAQKKYGRAYYES